MGKILVIFIFSILFLSFFVLAVGTSTISEEDTRNSTKEMREIDKENSRSSTLDCESPTVRRERIKCRLQNKVENNGTPEACRKLNLDSKEQCVRFYVNVRACYKLNGTSKDACFRRVSGFVKASLNEQRANPEKIRNYVVSLLYDLEERVENKNKAGEISSEDAAKLIDQIEDIKNAILSDEANKTEIKSMMQQLKNDWKSLMPKTEDKNE